MRRLACLAALAALALPACGGSDARPDEILAETAENLGEIKSGTLSLRLVVDPTGDAQDEFGFELRGPFSLPQAGRLPTARLAYTQIAGDQRGSATFVSTGTRAFVSVAGSTYELPPSDVEDLRGAARPLAEGGGLEELSIGDWFEEGEHSDGGDVGGTETDRVQGRLNAVNAVNDLLELARKLGRADLERIQGRDVRRLSDATRAASFDLRTGKEDRLLRRLRIDAEFGLDVPPELESALGTSVGASVVFELGIDDPNRPVNVATPTDVRPYSEIPRG